MRDPTGRFLEFFRLERKRGSSGLSVTELERWSRLKQEVDRHMRKEAGPRSHPARRSVRVPTRLHCSFASRSELDEAMITNLSAGGVFISTSQPLPIGEKLLLNVHLGGRASIEVEAIVVSNNVGASLRAGAEGMGLRFVSSSSDVLREIHDLYEQELAREKPPLVRGSRATR